MQGVAKLITRVFDPVILVPVIVFGVVSLAMVNGYDWQFLILILVLDALIPGVFVVVRYLKKGKDWDIRDRKERMPLYGLTLASNLLGVMAAYYFGFHPLAELLLGMWVLMLVFAGVTSVYKISVHAGVSSVLAFFVIYFFGWDYWWIWLVPIAVSWSRVYLGMHERGQVILGMIVPPVVLYAVYSLLGLI